MQVLWKRYGIYKWRQWKHGGKDSYATTVTKLFGKTTIWFLLCNVFFVNQFHTKMQDDYCISFILIGANLSEPHIDEFAVEFLSIYTSGNRTPGSRSYSDLLDTSVCIHQLVLKRRQSARLSCSCRQLAHGLFQLTHMSHDDHAVQLGTPRSSIQVTNLSSGGTWVWQYPTISLIPAWVRDYPASTSVLSQQICYTHHRHT